MVRIGLVFNTGLAYCRGVLRGIRQYAQSRPDWVLLPVAAEPKAVRSLGGLGLAGAIAQVYSPALADALEALGRPYVNVSGVLTEPGAPWVFSDDEAVGRAAAEHLLDRGLRHFGYFGHRKRGYSVRREAGFRRAVEGPGRSLDCYLERDSPRFDPIEFLWALDEGVQRWLRSLPKPAGVFASNDIWGVQLAEVCRQADLRVPEDVALVGVDNDDLLCEMARPPLSSVVTAAGRIGQEAAAVLDRMLKGAAPPRRPLLVPPVGVVARQSSDVLTMEDPEVVAAVRFIRERAHEPISVGDVARRGTISRRSLERRFRAALDRGVGEEIRRAHLERARGLLANTALPMSVVAKQSGFSDQRQLSVLFRRESGQTPTEYRRLRGVSRLGTP
jgi:LacI family transcriptional regulator